MKPICAAYDICPQAMLISGDNRRSRIASCIEAAHHFLLTQDEVMEISSHQKHVIESNWKSVCDEVALSEVDQNLLWGRQFLNAFSAGYPR